MSDELLPQTLRVAPADRIATALRALGSIVDVQAPGLGALYGELVGKIIPGLREERLVEFVAKCARRIATITEGQSYQLERIEVIDAKVERLIQQLSEPQIELFVEGATASGRATSKDRIEQISKLVAQGLLAEDVSVERERLLLRVLAELTDGELVALCSYDTRYRLDSEWWTLHKAVVEPKSLLVDERGEWPWARHEGWDEAEALEAAREAHFLSLGLLEEKPVMSEADDGGSGALRGRYEFSPGSAALSKLGRLLLKEVGPKG